MNAASLKLFALLSAASPLIAQSAVPTHAQLMRGVVSSASTMSQAPSLLLTSPALGASTVVQGIDGVLQIDAARMQSIPLQSVAVFEAQLKLRSASASHVYYQILRFDERGNGRISRLREFGVDKSLQFAQRDSEAVCRGRALLRISEAFGTEMAEGWSRMPKIVRTTPMYRPDVRGVAYYEFELDAGGFVLASTGEHDRVLTNWSSVGTSKTAQLEEVVGQKVHKIYKLDTLSYVAEGANGEMLGRVGNLPDRLLNLPAVLREGTPIPASLDRRAWASWSELKVQYAATYRPLIRQLRDRHASLWRLERQSSPITPMSWGSWNTTSADGGTAAQPRYTQHTYRGCAVGCGPVAWAMVFCWADRQAHQGNSAWSGRTGLYRTNGGRSGSSAVAPLYMEQGVKNVTQELNRLMGTWCITGSGATWPSRMDDAAGYLSGRTGARCYSGGSDVGYNSNSYRDQIRASIRDRDTPAVMGTGFLSHYPVAYKYSYRTKTDFFGTHYQRMFYVNQGWGSTDYFEWVDAGSFLYGILRR